MLTSRDPTAGPDDGAYGLIADIGGTNVRFALTESAGAAHEIVVLKCRDFPNLETATETYLSGVSPLARPRRAAFAIACPVIGDHVAMTNHPWAFSIEAIRRRLRLDVLTVLNDFVAVALSTPRLANGDCRQVGGDADSPLAPIAVIGPGTGLGVGGLVPCGGGWMPVPSEGGHVTLAATTEREAEILRLLRARFTHVSAERVLSGPGLVNLYRALCQIGGTTADTTLEPDQVAERGMTRSCPVCAEALETFCALLGSVAGDLCLTYGARGGLYIAGGIVPKLGDYFPGSPFRQRFEAKGRFVDYLAPIPAHVITRETPAFLGLAGLVNGGAAS